MDRNYIYESVVDILEQVGIEKDVVKIDSSLQADLGIESIDLLDVQFRLERKFNVVFERGELFPDEIFTDKSVSINGSYVTDIGRTELMAAIPHADWDNVPDPLLVKDIPNLFTVKSLINFIEAKTKDRAAMV